MPVGAVLEIDQFSGGIGRGIVMPASVKRAWYTAIEAGGPAVQDAATITNPSTEIDGSTTRRLILPIGATLIAVRLGYDDALTSITAPVVKLFGRHDSNDMWMILRSLANAETVSLAAAASDLTDGTLLYTGVDNERNIFDCKGKQEIWIGVETALAGTGITNNSIIQVQVY